MPITAPFPYFGNKRRIAREIWRRFGDVPNMVDPFCGSLAVPLLRPHRPRVETFNDIDPWLCNFWRATSSENGCYHVADFANYPVIESDLTARHRWLAGEGKERLQTILTDPDFFDVQVAGWWVWGLSAWIGGGWCDGKYQVGSQVPLLSAPGQGVHALKWQKGSEEKTRAALVFLFKALRDRLRHSRILCGDWKRCLTDAVTLKHGMTAVLLDSPYTEGECAQVYTVGSGNVAAEAGAWALANGDNPLLRIALCGYDGCYEMPPSWEVLRWKSDGGYSSTGDGRGKENAKRETIWFSPACLKPARPSLFTDLDEEEEVDP